MKLNALLMIVLGSIIVLSGYLAEQQAREFYRQGFIDGYYEANLNQIGIYDTTIWINTSFDLYNFTITNDTFNANWICYYLPNWTPCEVIE